jgi:hypothetical protein
VPVLRQKGGAGVQAFHLPRMPAACDRQSGRYVAAALLNPVAPGSLEQEVGRVLGRAFEAGLALDDTVKLLKPLLADHPWWIDEGSVLNPRTKRKNKTRPAQEAIATIYDVWFRVHSGARNFDQIQRTKEPLPFLRYVRPGDCGHSAWNGLILWCDDPWWTIFYPPNSWDCQCYADSLGEPDLARRGYELGLAPVVAKRRLKSPFADVEIELPEGIAPGFYGLPSERMARSLLRWWLNDPIAIKQLVEAQQ